MQALYRKYRPKLFSEVVGQNHVKTLFLNSLKNGEISHAYIFAGPRGTGKTTVARILAKSLNCENKNGVEPCNKCNTCQSIDNGSFMDVLEIDAASNRGIDEIRKIRETVGYHAAQGNYKVYIIDEVHMLTKEAFNALLKTLEEPPSNVVFILATTNPEKIPQTIISRCQVIDFKNITIEDIIKRLEFVCKKENINISQEALNEIAKRANGGMRDALTILEQVSKSSSKNITIEDVRETLGLVPIEVINEIIDSIKIGDIKKTTEIIEKVYFSGKDPEVFLMQLLEEMILKIESGDYELIEFLKPLSEILKDIKYSEEKLILIKLGFLSVMKLKPPRENIKKNVEKAEENEPVPESKLNDKDLESTQNVENKEKKIENEENISKIMEYLKLHGDLSLYVGLSFSKIEELPDRVKITFPPEKKIHYELVRSKIHELEKLYTSKFGIFKPFEVIIKENSKEDDVLNKLKSLFGNNFIVEGDNE
ncbi:DNA polymerase III subunit gamma/tau [Thermosipho sp. (in: thermotogales)]|uniref:DNA polymerase III subunit gamma/tau n=1 Tax=Thermosipho sp. (in: thermotogales) TaxID=1968895 RepID=UPI00257BCC5C|nr:DNA polymerase III subunit gamma/tau [Thermosipho sp. (in: thermotogales)]MBZ4650158.1 polymerase gamma and tau subunit [Thermosipho sp. (in: thermotogales)]